MADTASGIIYAAGSDAAFKHSIGPGWDGRSGPVIIYGTGGVAIQLLERHGDAFATPRFANSDGSGVFQGQAVMAASEVASIPEARIVIASSFILPILRKLLELGIPAERIRWYHSEYDGFIDGNALRPPQKPSEILRAFYDLSVHRAIVDAAAFAVMAEAERRKGGWKAIEMVLVPAADMIIAAEDRLDQPMYNAEAIFTLLPSVIGLLRLANRDAAAMLAASAAACFPEGYDPAMPRHEAGLSQIYRATLAGFSPHCLTAPATAKRIVAGFLSRHLAGRRLVTLSLRELPGEPDRAAPLGDWRRLLAGLDRQRYLVVVLRHADCAFDAFPPGLPDCTEFLQASIDIACRMALYEAAALNLMDHQDYAALAMFSGSHYLIRKPHLPICFGKQAQDWDELTTRYGMAPGDTVPLARPGQHFLTRPGDMERILTQETGGWQGRDAEPIIRHAGPWPIDTWFPDDDLSLAYARNIGIYEKIDAPVEIARASIDWEDMLDDPDCGVFLLLGQSNGANAGETPHTPSGPAYSLSFFDMCGTVAADPLSGATNLRGSIWSRLGDLLVEQGLYRRILFLPVAVCGSSVAEWMPGGRCFRRLALLASRLRRVTGRSQLPISAVLWMQGETDAHWTTKPAETYGQQFLELVEGMREIGIAAPILMAQLTLCGLKEPPNRLAVRQARDLLIANHPDILPGPDLDELGFDMRFDDCHFSHEGLRRAARAWLGSLKAHHERLAQPGKI